MDVQIGCPHYKRKCLFVTPCCNKKYPCRLCHNAAEDHQLSRTEVRKVQCILCTAVQPVAEKCKTCRIPFGQYVCLKCNLFDYVQKGQFHCEGCGICRVGGRENFFHCPKCNMCLNIRLEFNHKCIENASHANCPICLEDLHSSVETIKVPTCGHLIHQKCYDSLSGEHHGKCSVCAAPLRFAM